MLTITDNAGVLVNDLVSRAVPTDTGGIRIAAREGEFAVSVDQAPTATDVVAENGGARVFMDGTVAEVLDDKVLDARVGDDGGVQFLIAAQPA